ncbi:hypothetical protein RFI_28599, partial [Reticulomyxa filosa]
VENKKQIKKMKENENKQIEELNVNSFIFQMLFFLQNSNTQMNDVKAEILKKDQQIIGLTNDIQQLKTEMNQTINDLKQQQNEQIDNLKDKLLEKIQTIIALVNNIQQLKMGITQHDIETTPNESDQSKEYKKDIKLKLDNRNTNIQKLLLYINAQIEKKEEEEEEEEDVEDSDGERDSTISKFHDCNEMVSIVSWSTLENGVDFLLVNVNDYKVKLKNNKWCNYNFGVYLVGEYITVTVNCDKAIDKKELGHLKIKASHLWIKHPSSTIDCSGLGYPSDQGPGKGGAGGWGGGGGYGTKGGDIKTFLGVGKGGTTYGEETLQKEICFGSGGGRESENDYGGSGGGIIELIIEHQLLNYGSIQSNGGDIGMVSGGGSGGSILIKLLQCSFFPHDFGTIQCIGGNQSEPNKGGKGRIAIYGEKLQPDDIKKIDPKPFNSIDI